MNTHLLIRADASPEIGAGHVMRCLAIAQAWQHRGGEALFVCSELSDSMRQRLEYDRMNVAMIAATIGSEQDAAATIAIAEAHSPQAVVVDGYRFDADYLSTITTVPSRTLFMDDNAELTHYPTDFVLNPNIEATHTLYPRMAEQTRLLLGRDFTLLRKEFLDPLSPRPMPQDRTAADPVRVLVTLGGSDPENVTLKVAKALTQIKRSNFEARIILGGMSQHRASIESVIGDDIRVSVIQDVANMAIQYDWADFAVSAGGGSNWEMCMRGLPRILLVIADNQIATARACEAAQTAINLGDAANVSPTEIASAIEDLANDNNQQAQLSQNARQLIDGLGATRVVNQLSLFQADTSTTKSRDVDDLVFRSATMSDAEMLLDWRNDTQTSQASRSSETIDLASHKQWLEATLQNHDRRLWIAATKIGEPVGTVRIDLLPPCTAPTAARCELSWTVAPSARRRGIGGQMVRQISAMLGVTAKAVTRRDNIASQKVATSAGFELVKDDGEWMTFEKREARSE